MFYSRLRSAPRLCGRPIRTAAVRCLSSTPARRDILDVDLLPNRIQPSYKQNASSSLLSLQWPEPPRNILIIPKLHAPKVTQSAVEFAEHIHSEYPNLNIIFERRIASEIHGSLSFPVYTASPTHLPPKIDLVATLGGDGTILRAASLFSLHESVPPILSFSMGSLGFLGEWKFDEYKRAWREVYMSGSRVAVSDLQDPHTRYATNGRGDEDGDGEYTVHESWASVRGKSMGARSSKILLRNRLKVGVYDAQGNNINEQLMPTSTSEFQQPLPPVLPRNSGPDLSVFPAFHAINELVIHRGPNPHLAMIDVYVNNHFLTESIADGILVSTPTGSTAYSLSAGGSIMHPLVKTLLITPICPRSLSFRPLGLPLTTKVTLKLSDKNRGRELEVSIDGKRRTGVTVGMEIRIEGEEVGQSSGSAGWSGGVPCVIRRPSRDGVEGIAEDDDGWVGGLNGLLGFNYPFGERQQ